MLTSMSRLPLHTLPVFRMAARLQNLRAAAVEMHLTHSAVSQQIGVLETQLGFALFERRGRRIVLNDAGQALLCSVESALAQLDAGMLAAAATAVGNHQRLRLTVMPSFLQRWLLPRMQRWRERHPDIALELHSSQHVMDLQREGFHAGLRQGRGGWPGLSDERLLDSPLVPVACAATARRLQGASIAALAHEPLLGDADLWDRWFREGGLKLRSNPVASFNDAGLMLQAAEQGLGIALGREFMVADALRDGLLVRLSEQRLQPDAGYASYFLVYPPTLRDWKPLQALREWLHEEVCMLQQSIPALTPVLTPLPTPSEQA
ncbi:LysR substrate-binding domain-containing protein [Collimonas sp.]|jgi:LysR family glycine cleavage system transcriptional activator|uniref:LysR substrate-binding domain-containing protein n=1 Tax=Collimonas sp. TaxID=1963772 RepID=UPI0037BE862D